MKKVVAVLLIMAMCISLAACGNSGQTSSSASTSSTSSKDTSAADSSSQAKPDKIVEISASILDRGAIAAGDGTYEENRVTQWINDQVADLGIKVNWVPVPRNQSRDKLNAMIAAETAPDLLWEYSRGWVSQLKQQKVILPVNDIIEKYSVDYKEYYNKNKAVIDPYVTMDDGMMYALTSLRAANSLPTAGVWYRKDLLDEAGVQEPKTLEDVIDTVKAVQAKHSDVVGISASIHYLNILKGTYGMSTNDQLEDEKLVHAIFTSKYKDCMDMARRFYLENIVDNEYIVDTAMTRQQQLWTSGKAIFKFDSASLPAGSDELIKANSNVELRPLEPFESQYGKYMLTPQPMARFFINFNAKMNDEKQEAGMKFLDWMLTNGWYTTAFGIEGEQYTLSSNGLRQGIVGAKAWPGSEYALLTQETYVFGQAEFSQIDPALKEVSKFSDEGIRKMLSFPVCTVLPFDYSSDDYSTFTASFTPKMSEIETRIITDTNYTVDAGIAELQQVFKDLGGEDIWVKKNEWYKDNQNILSDFAKAYDDYKAQLIK